MKNEDGIEVYPSGKEVPRFYQYLSPKDTIFAYEHRQEIESKLSDDNIYNGNFFKERDKIIQNLKILDGATEIKMNYPEYLTFDNSRFREVVLPFFNKQIENLSMRYSNLESLLGTNISMGLVNGAYIYSYPVDRHYYKDYDYTRSERVESLIKLTCKFGYEFDNDHNVNLYYIDDTTCKYMLERDIGPYKCLFDNDYTRYPGHEDRITLDPSRPEWAEYKERNIIFNLDNVLEEVIRTEVPGGLKSMLVPKAQRNNKALFILYTSSDITTPDITRTIQKVLNNNKICVAIVKTTLEGDGVYRGPRQLNIQHSNWGNIDALASKLSSMKSNIMFLNFRSCSTVNDFVNLFRDILDGFYEWVQTGNVKCFDDLYNYPSQCNYGYNNTPDYGYGQQPYNYGYNNTSDYGYGQQPSNYGYNNTPDVVASADSYNSTTSMFDNFDAVKKEEKSSIQLDKSAYNQPSYDQGYNQSSYNQGYAQSYNQNYGQPSYDQSYGQPSYDQSYNQPSYNQPSYNQNYNQPSYDQSYSQSSYNQPSYNQNYNQPSYVQDYNPTGYNNDNSSVYIDF